MSSLLDSLKSAELTFGYAYLNAKRAPAVKCDSQTLLFKLIFNSPLAASLPCLHKFTTAFKLHACIAADISLPTQTIRTESVESWRRHPISIGKRPCVFIILA